MDIGILNRQRFVRFGLVGTSGLLVNSIVLFLGYEVASLPLTIASILAVETAIANNYLWNNLWTFAQRTFSLAKFLKFNLVSLAGMALTVATLTSLVQYFGWHYLIANVFAVAITMLWNFVANSLWTWSGVGQDAQTG
ncbi:MAG: GtrA family protein [Chloroflexota bacterium]